MPALNPRESREVPSVGPEEPSKPALAFDETAKVSIETTAVSIERTALSIKRIGVSIKRIAVPIETIALSIERIALSIKTTVIPLKTVALSFERIAVSIEKTPFSSVLPMVLVAGGVLSGVRDAVLEGFPAFRPVACRFLLEQT